MRVIDYNYYDYENNFYTTRSSGSFIADFLEAGTNLASIISKGERAKSIISSALAAFKQDRKSFNLDFYREKSFEVLIIKMQTARDRKKREMLLQMKKDVSGSDYYDLDTALTDIVEYFFAGGLPSALKELQVDSAQNAQEAKNQLDIIKGLKPSPVPSQAQIVIATNAKTALEKLGNDLKGPNKAVALLSLQNIVKTLEGDDKIRPYLQGESVTSTTIDGEKILKALIEIRRTIDFAPNLPDKNDLLTRVNNAIIAELTAKPADTSNN